MEQAVGEMAAELRADPTASLDARTVEATIARLRAEGYPVSGEQARAIRYGAGAASGRIAIVEGAAGSGKTTTLRPLADLYKDAGYTVLGSAVAWRTAVALGSDCDIKPYSVDKMLRMAARDALPLDARTVLIVDEAGMLSVRQAHHILRLASEHGCKVVFAGDTRQHQAIEAGPGLRLAREAANGVRVDTIRRQQPDLEDVLVHVHGLEPGQARFEAGMTSAEDKARILAEYRAMPDKPAFEPWQIAASQALRDGDAAGAIAAYDARGRFHLCRTLDATLDRIVRDWERYRAANPDKSCLVVARTNDECAALSHVMRERNLAGRAEAERVVVQVAGHGRATKALEIAEGDLLRIGATMWKQQMYNGTLVEVTGLRTIARGTDDERVEISGRSEYGRDVKFHVDEVKDYFGNVRLAHGYAMTIASAQGRTVDAAFVLADDAPAASTIYPALTRHKEELDIYVDRARVALSIEATRTEDAAGEPVTDAELRAHLARRWSRIDEKVAARDHMSPAMRAAFARQPGGKGGADWAAANDNGDGRLRATAGDMRAEAARWKYGDAVDACAAAMREVDAGYEGRRARRCAPRAGRGAAPGLPRQPGAPPGAARLAGEDRVHVGGPAGRGRAHRRRRGGPPRQQARRGLPRRAQRGAGAPVRAPRGGLAVAAAVGARGRRCARGAGVGRLRDLSPRRPAPGRLLDRGRRHGRAGPQPLCPYPRPQAGQVARRCDRAARRPARPRRGGPRTAEHHRGDARGAPLPGRRDRGPGTQPAGGRQPRRSARGPRRAGREVLARHDAAGRREPGRAVPDEARAVARPCRRAALARRRVRARRKPAADLPRPGGAHRDP